MSTISVIITICFKIIFCCLQNFHSVNNYRECDDQSRDEGHHGDEEDSNATSISDAMIDDEIADQPGLVMLGQVDYYSH